MVKRVLKKASAGIAQVVKAVKSKPNKVSHEAVKAEKPKPNEVSPEVVKAVKSKPQKERRLLIYFTNKHGQTIILGEEKKLKKPGEPDEPSRFAIEKGQKVRLAVQALLRKAMPCFHELDMELITRGNVEHFFDNHIEYDLVKINIYDVIGIPKGANPEDLLSQCGFILIPLSEHHLKDRLIPKIGRP